MSFLEWFPSAQAWTFMFFHVILTCAYCFGEALEDVDSDFPSFDVDYLALIDNIQNRGEYYLLVGRVVAISQSVSFQASTLIPSGMLAANAIAAYQV